MTVTVTKGEKATTVSGETRATIVAVLTARGLGLPTPALSDFGDYDFNATVPGLVGKKAFGDVDIIAKATPGRNASWRAEIRFRGRYYKLSVHKDSAQLSCGQKDLAESCLRWDINDDGYELASSNVPQGICPQDVAVISLILGTNGALALALAASDDREARRLSKSLGLSVPAKLARAA